MFWKIRGADRRKTLVCPLPVTLTLPGTSACPPTSGPSVFHSKGLFIVFQIWPAVSCLSCCLWCSLIRMPLTRPSVRILLHLPPSSHDSPLLHGTFLMSSGSSNTPTPVLPSASYYSFQGSWLILRVDESSMRTGTYLPNPFLHSSKTQSFTVRGIQKIIVYFWKLVTLKLVRPSSKDVWLLIPLLRYWMVSPTFLYTR